MTCTKGSICNLYKNKILKGIGSEDVYKSLYCNTAGFKKCRRYQIFELAGECPDFIMPNSKHNTDYILRKIEEEQSLPNSDDLPFSYPITSK